MSRVVVGRVDEKLSGNEAGESENVSYMSSRAFPWVFLRPVSDSSMTCCD